MSLDRAKFMFSSYISREKKRAGEGDSAYANGTEAVSQSHIILHRMENADSISK